MIQLPLELRFWSQVEFSTNCWEWVGHTDKDGYGQFSYNGTSKKAHRVAWFLYTGKWPTKSILHTCDNPPCMRRKHLYEGTQADNMRDRKDRGNQPKGEQHWQARLNPAKVRLIRATKLPDKVWAKRFGVAVTTISGAKLGQKWKSVD